MEGSKSQVKSVPCSSNKINSKIDKLFNSNPVYRIPNEVWELIIDNVGSSKDLINLSKAVPICGKIAHPTRVKWLFDQVLPLVVEKLTLSRKEVLNCRLVSKRWRYGVDHFLENNAVQRPAFGDDEIEISKKLDLPHELLDRFYNNQDMCYHSRRTERQKERLLDKAVNHPNNPIVGRCAFIKYPPRSYPPEMANESTTDLKYLKTFGIYIYFLQIQIQEGRQVSYLKRLVELFSLVDLPNLKKLELKEFSIYSGQRGAEEDCYTTAKELYNYFNSLTDEQKNRFPKNLETLIIRKQDQFCSAPLKQIILKLFYSENISSFDVNIFTLPVGVNFSNLVHLNIWLVSIEAVQALIRLNSPIRKLCLRFDMDDPVDTELIFKGINHFQSTLKYLELNLGNIMDRQFFSESTTVDLKPFNKPGSLHLPNLRTFKFKNYCPPSFNFITGLQSLQYIYLDLTLDNEWNYFLDEYFVETKPEKEILDIKSYLEKVYGNGEEHMKRPRIYESQIWKHFKRLLVFDLFISKKHVDALGKNEIRSRYHRNYYEFFEGKKYVN